MMRDIVWTALIGYLPIAVSPDSISVSLPSKTALAISDASARVGRGLSIIVSSIWVAVITHLSFTFAQFMMCFWSEGTRSGDIVTPKSPLATITPSHTSRIASIWSTPSGVSSLAMIGVSWAFGSFFVMVFRSSTKSSARRTKDNATISTLCSNPNERSSRSLEVRGGDESWTPGRWIPWCLPKYPPAMTSVSTSDSEMEVTTSSIAPSSIRILSPGLTSRGRAG